MIDAATLLELSQLTLSTEQMAGVLRIVARLEQAIEEYERISKERLRKDRERKRNIPGNSVETKENTPIPPKENNNIKTPPCSPSRPQKGWERSPQFLELIAVFPPRSGDRDLKGSFNAFNAALKRETFPVIIDGAKRYRDHADATGKTNTEYVRQIRTWLNKDGWKETYGQNRGSPAGRPKSMAETFANLYAKGEELERQAGDGGDVVKLVPRLLKGS
jgi:hypothetical protein